MKLNEINYRLSDILEALGNAIRLKIVILLEESSRSVSSCAEELDKPIQTVSRHLKKLRDKNLLEAESKGPRRIYKLKRPELIRAILDLRSLISREVE
ncbi:MAG: ArsR/SmtB family transcription factor [bacterium]